MNRDEFMDLALRVTEGTVTPAERARFEEELIRQPPLRAEWLALRHDLQAAREATVAAEVLAGRPEEIPGHRLDELLGRKLPPSTPQGRLTWLTGSLAAAAAIGVAFWLGSGPQRNPVGPTADAARLAFVVPRGGEASVATPGGVRVSALPVPLTGVESVTIAAGREAWLLTPDGKVTTIRGTYRSVPATQGPVARGLAWLTTPLALLGVGPALTRGGDDLRLLSPRGATATTEPPVVWTAEPGRTYDVELRDALQPAVAPARMLGVAPPLTFRDLRTEPLALGGIYILRVTETGRPASAVSGRFMVVAPPADFAGETDPASVTAAAFRALAESPARAGDAWLLLQQLPAEWRESELGRRLAAAVGTP
jgi:hypothetical protein